MINLGVSMGILPTKGLTLPFVSAGGSSLLVMCIAIGLVLRINLELRLAEGQALRMQNKKRTERKKSSKKKVTNKKRPIRNE